MRIAICGGPRSGKTTLARDMGVEAASNLMTMPIMHTDDVMDQGWSEASLAVALWMDQPGPWIIEGVAVLRALRKWLQLNPTGSPCDKLIVLSYHSTDPRHAGMTKGIQSVLNDIHVDLLRRGVEIELR